MPVRFFVTADTAADGTLLLRALIKDIPADFLIADRSCDGNKTVWKALEAGMSEVIPPRRDRKEVRKYDRCLYKFRHLAENSFLALRRLRGTAACRARIYIVLCCRHTSLLYLLYLGQGFGITYCRYRLEDSFLLSAQFV